MIRLRQELFANRCKNEFFMAVTHELQSPLATILRWAQFLQTESLDPDTQARALAVIVRNATVETKLLKVVTGHGARGNLYRQATTPPKQG